MTKPPRLGKGLSALLGEAAAPNPDNVRSLPVTALEPSPFQARGPMDPDALEELAASIRQHGVLQPILVRPKPGSPGEYQIIGGERRWRAAQAAPLHEVPVVIRDFDDSAAMAAGLVENLQREDLNALEEAEGYDRLTSQFGLTQLQLSEPWASPGPTSPTRCACCTCRHACANCCATAPSAPAMPAR